MQQMNLIAEGTCKKGMHVEWKEIAGWGHGDKTELNIQKKHKMWEIAFLHTWNPRRRGDEREAQWLRIFQK